MIEWTRVRLQRWGKWSRGRSISGYPTASAFFWANMGGRMSGSTVDVPQDIAEIDSAVARIPITLRQTLIVFYCTTGPLWWKATKLYVSRRTLMRRVARAEERVHQQLTLADAPK